MKWDLPKDGDVRVRREFAWFPVQIDRTKVWLQRYYVREKYQVMSFYSLHSEGWEFQRASVLPIGVK